MMIDFAKKIRNIDGEEMRLARPGRDAIPMTLALVAIEAILADDPDANTAALKVERFMLASRIHGAAGELDLSPEEVALIRACVGSKCPTLICGRAFELLDPPK